MSFENNWCRISSFSILCLLSGNFWEAESYWEYTLLSDLAGSRIKEVHSFLVLFNEIWSGDLVFIQLLQSPLLLQSKKWEGLLKLKILFSLFLSSETWKYNFLKWESFLCLCSLLASETIYEGKSLKDFKLWYYFHFFLSTRISHRWLTPNSFGTKKRKRINRYRRETVKF